MRYLWWQNLLSSPLCPHCPVGSQNMCNEHVRKTEPKGLKGGLGTNFPTFLAPWTLHMRKWRRRVKKASSCHVEGRIFSGAALLGLGDRAWRSRGTHLQPPWLTITCILFLLLCPSFRPFSFGLRWHLLAVLGDKGDLYLGLDVGMLSWSLDWTRNPRRVRVLVSKSVSYTF